MMFTSPHRDAASPARYIRDEKIPAIEINILAGQVAEYCERHGVENWTAANQAQRWLASATEPGRSPGGQKYCLRGALMEIRSIARRVRRRAGK